MNLITLISSLFGKQQIRGTYLNSLKKLIRRPQALGRKIKAERKLKKSGYETWRAYKHNRDPGVQRYAQCVEDFYIDYPYIYGCENPTHYAYDLIADYGPGSQRFGYEEMNDWCHDKIKWNFRCDYHRVWENQFTGKMEFNDIGGYDIIYFAFKREQDFTHFLLRWP